MKHRTNCEKEVVATIKKKYIQNMLLAIVTITLALAGCGKTTNTPSSNQSQQESIMPDNTTAEPDNTENQTEITTPETETGPTRNSDGKYVYIVDGHELPLSILLEDYIDGDVVDIGSIQESLGYTRGTIVDDAGNTIASTGEFSNTEFYLRANKANKDEIIDIYVCTKNGSASPVMKLGLVDNAHTMSFDTLIVMVYLWDYYSDGEIHPTPFSGWFEENVTNNNRVFKYWIP